MSIFAAHAPLQKATIAARERTGDSRIGTRAGAGSFQIVRVTPRGNTSDVEVLTDYLPMPEAVAYLDQMGA